MLQTHYTELARQTAQNEGNRAELVAYRDSKGVWIEETIVAQHFQNDLSLQPLGTIE